MEYFGAQERLILCFDSLSLFALHFSSVFQYDSVRLAHAASLLVGPWRGPVPGEAALGYMLSSARPGNGNNSASKKLLVLRHKHIQRDVIFTVLRISQLR